MTCNIVRGWLRNAKKNKNKNKNKKHKMSKVPEMISMNEININNLGDRRTFPVYIGISALLEIRITPFLI